MYLIVLQNESKASKQRPFSCTFDHITIHMDQMAKWCHCISIEDNRNLE